MPLCMKKSIITTIIAALSFIVTISLISATAYAQQQEQQLTRPNSLFYSTKLQANPCKIHYKEMNHLKLNWR